MKTTVEIADSLLDAVREEALKRRTTVRALIEAGLRKVLEERQKSLAFKLRRVTVKGKGLQPPFDENDWPSIRERGYEGRGT
jgi:hypothetical protein